jgi:hypothetical protein
MKTTIQKRLRCAAYSLVEVVVASSVLMIGVGAACVLSLTMIGLEESHTRIARGVNLVENATRLYQLGLDSSEILALLPPDKMVTSFTATTQTSPPISGIGTPQFVAWTMLFSPVAGTTTWSAGSWGGKPDTAISGNSDVRTIGPIKSYRTSIR